MHCTNEEQFKKCIASRDIRPLYLLFGSEPALLSAYRKKLLSGLCEGENNVDRMSGKSLDLPAFYDSAQLLSMFGTRRIISIDEFEAESLSADECKELCSFFGELTDDVSVVIIAVADSFDLKKGKNAKKLLAAADKYGVAAQLDRRSPSELKNQLRARCKRAGCELPAECAAFLIERCGADLGTLINECDKLCAYAAGQAITNEMICNVCSGTLTADPFALARLMQKGDLKAVLSQINTLLAMRQPVPLILYNLGSAFCDLARACAARSSGKSASDMHTELSYKFDWLAKNAFRDSARLDSARAFAVCEVLCDAEVAMKSSPADDRILLEAAVVRSMQILQRGVGEC